MLILALDTTTRGGSAAVVRDGDVLAVVQGDAGRTHGERLPGEIERALAQAAVPAADIELLAVATGPGAFTGLRIGLAAIQGLAMVLNLPVAGVSALDALALAAAEASDYQGGPIEAWMDAARGEVFAAHYARPGDESGSVTTATAVVGTPADRLAALPGDPAGSLFIGDGAERYREAITAHTAGAARIVAAPAALAPYIARLAAGRQHRGEAGPPHALQPLYVRRSDAELARLRPRP